MLKTSRKQNNNLSGLPLKGLPRKMKKAFKSIEIKYDTKYLIKDDGTMGYITVEYKYAHRTKHVLRAIAYMKDAPNCAFIKIPQEMQDKILQLQNDMMSKCFHQNVCDIKELVDTLKR